MKKALTYILFAAALLALLCSTAQADPWDGSGMAADPYIISSAADLAAMREYVAAEGYPGGLVFKLGADIDLGDYCGPARGSWTPIRVPDSFDGIFDGGGHTITGLYINRPDLEKVGLFNATGTGAGGTIKNLTVEGEVTGGSLTGGIIGSLTCEMVNCSFIGTVEGTDKVGGIAGYNGGVIDNCRVSGHRDRLRR